MRIEILKEILHLHKEYIRNNHLGLSEQDGCKLRQLFYDHTYEEINKHGIQHIPDFLEVVLLRMMDYYKRVKRPKLLETQSKMVDAIDAELKECFTKEEHNWLTKELSKHMETLEIIYELTGIFNAIRDFQN